MNRDKVFTALAAASSEYETYYGVMRVRYADFQRLRAMASLVDAAKQSYSEVDSLSCYDTLTNWFEAVPWAVKDRREITDQLNEGYWVEVPGGDVEEEAEDASPTRTVMERMNVYSREFGSTFYEKHGDVQYSSPWILLATIGKFFGEED